MSGPAPRSPVLPIPSAAAAGATSQATIVTPGGEAPLRRLGAQVSNVWLPRLCWRIASTGRPGLAGLALLGASAVFFFSTQLPVADEVLRLRSDLIEAQIRAGNAPPTGSREPAEALQSLPMRTEMPRVLGVLLKQAGDVRLTIDTAKYEISSTKAGALVRYRLSFPINGPYPRVRQFIDSTLRAIPALSIDDLSIARKAIGDDVVEAQLRMSIFARSAP